MQPPFASQAETGPCLSAVVAPHLGAALTQPGPSEDVRREHHRHKRRLRRETACAAPLLLHPPGESRAERSAAAPWFWAALILALSRRERKMSLRADLGAYEHHE
jgi:hypothetical protein